MCSPTVGRPHPHRCAFSFPSGEFSPPEADSSPLPSSVLHSASSSSTSSSTPGERFGLLSSPKDNQWGGAGAIPTLVWIQGLTLFSSETFHQSSTFGRTGFLWFCVQSQGKTGSDRPTQRPKKSKDSKPKVSSSVSFSPLNRFHSENRWLL